MNSVERKITSARTTLLLDEPFWGGLALKLTPVEDLTAPTAWTDGQYIGYNPQFVDSLTAAELLALWVHEIAHCAYGHPWRRGGRDPERWNEGADLAINSVLRSAGYQLPEGGLFPEQYELQEGRSAEWYCDRLPTPPPTQGEQGKGNGKPEPNAPPGAGGTPAPGPQDATAPSGGEKPPPRWGEVRDAPLGDPDATGAPTEAEWQQAVQSAAALANARGKLPGGMKRLVDLSGQSRVDWRSQTRKWIQEIARRDYSWVRPNSRYLPQGLYLPGLRSEEMGPVAIFLDTSGSIDDTLVKQFEVETQAFVEEVKPRRVYVGYCDARLHRVDVFERDELVVFRPVGGGGTDFHPAFAELEKFDEPVVAVIYLTDLDGSFPKTAPDVPVLWVVGRETAYRPPFGEVVSAAGG